jgi:hypothetical protein
MFDGKQSAGIGMCLLCEELWMPFELPPQPTASRFVADAPEPDPPKASRTQQGPAREKIDPQSP